MSHNDLQRIGELVGFSDNEISAYLYNLPNFIKHDTHIPKYFILSKDYDESKDLSQEMAVTLSLMAKQGDLAGIYDAVDRGWFSDGKNYVGQSILGHILSQSYNYSLQDTQALIGKGFKVSFDTIAKAIERGHGFPDNAALSFRRVDDIEILRRFVEVGLDLKASAYGSNILTNVLQFSGNTDMVKFLLEQGVPQKPTKLGLDALDIALSNLNSFDPDSLKWDNGQQMNKVKNVALLFATKQPRERSHLEKMFELNKRDPRIF